LALDQATLWSLLSGLSLLSCDGSRDRYANWGSTIITRAPLLLVEVVEKDADFVVPLLNEKLKTLYFRGKLFTLGC
jgi:hypothetical protein